VIRGVRKGLAADAVAIAIAGVLVLAGCAAPGNGGGAPNPALRGQWLLANATDSGGRLALAGQRITLTVDRDSNTTGRSTCSDYRAHIFGGLDALWVTTTHAAQPDCGSQLRKEVETRYFTDLEHVRAATRTPAGELDMTAPGIRLSFVPTMKIATAALVDKTWYLAAVSAADLTGSDEGPWYEEPGGQIDLSNEGVFTGATPCRKMLGRWHENAGEIVVDDLRTESSTECGGEIQKADDDLMKVIHDSFAVGFANDFLILRSSRRGVNLLLDGPGRQTLFR
jgi:hypothetical protein